MTSRHQKQQEAQQQAQKQFENTQAVTKDQREQTLMNAQIANMQSETAARQHLSDLQDKEYHDKHNAAPTALYGALKDAGGVPPIDGKVPESLTAYQLAQDYAKDPKIRQAPQGYTRHFIDKTDSSEVQWDGDKWTHPDGTPADMTDKTSIQVLDVPVDAMKTKRNITGAEINKISGQSIVDPDKNYNLAPIDLINLNNDRLKNENEAARTKHEGMLAAAQLRNAANEAEKDKIASYDAAYKQANLENGELTKTAADPLADPAAKAQAEAQIKSNNDNLRALYQQIFPNTKLKEGSAPPTTAAKVAHPDTQAALITIPGFNPATAVAVANMDPKAIPQYIADAPIPDDKKQQIYAALKIKPPAKPAGWTYGQLPGMARRAAQGVANVVTGAQFLLHNSKLERSWPIRIRSQMLSRILP